MQFSTLPLYEKPSLSLRPVIFATHIHFHNLLCSPARAANLFVPPSPHPCPAVVRCCLSQSGAFFWKNPCPNFPTSLFTSKPSKPASSPRPSKPFASSAPFCCVLQPRPSAPP